jgi:hypothetical protein
VREQMARECDYDMDLFIQMLRHAPKTDEHPSEPTPSETPSPAPPARKTRVRRKP